MAIEHVFADRPGDWTVSIVGSRGNDDWELTIQGPKEFERSYTLMASAGQHESEVNPHSARQAPPIFDLISCTSCVIQRQSGNWLRTYPSLSTAYCSLAPSTVPEFSPSVSRDVAPLFCVSVRPCCLPLQLRAYFRTERPNSASRSKSLPQNHELPVNGPRNIQDRRPTI